MATVDRLSVTVAPDLGASVRASAGQQGVSVSTWMAAAAAARLRNELLGAALDEWEQRDGAFTTAELDTAATALKASAVSGAA